MENNSNELVEKMSKFSMIMGIVGVCLIGIVPAFGMMAIAVPIAFKTKNIELTQKQNKNCKLGLVLGLISIILFVVDFVIATKFL